MKKILNVLACGAFAATAMLAQPPMGSPPDPATMVQNRVQYLTALLSLTTSQVTQATTIFTNAQTAITPLQTTLSQDFTSMQTAVKGNATATIDQLATSIGTVTGQITAIQNKAEAAFYAILTTDQQTKYAALGGGRGLGPGGFGARMRGQ
jgi:Spy/CpxP family protein refolding chaperone